MFWLPRLTGPIPLPTGHPHAGLFYFYNLGYTPLAVASLFIFYEVFGIVTNLFGGYRRPLRLKTTLLHRPRHASRGAVDLAFAPQGWLVVAWVMVSRALSGIAKDMTKMSSSAGSAIVPGPRDESLVAILTGSKNALGSRFFLGSLLLTVLGFQTALKLSSRWSAAR